MKLCHPGKACTNPWFANHYTCFLNSSLSPKDQILLDNQSHAQETARTLAEGEWDFKNLCSRSGIHCPRHCLQQTPEGLRAKHFFLVLSYGAKDGMFVRCGGQKQLRREACQLTIILSSTSQDILLPNTWHSPDERIVSDITQSFHLWDIPRGLELRHALLFLK